jgi:cell division GTPase FtsZ
MPFTMDDIVTNEAKIKIIGVGGGGGVVSPDS